jgi:acetyl esterase/lipase
VLAAADALASLPSVDANRIYLCGHSVGVTLALLAAMASNRFRVAASLSGSPDLESYLRVSRDQAPFDASDIREVRLRYGTRGRGETASGARLKEPEVLEIRRLVADGASTGDLAARFGVGTANIMAIVNRRTWKHLP